MNLTPDGFGPLLPERALTLDARFLALTLPLFAAAQQTPPAAPAHLLEIAVARATGSEDRLAIGRFATDQETFPPTGETPG